MSDLSVYINPDNSRVILFDSGKADTVMVYRSYAPIQDWQHIATLTGGECSYVDSDQLTWNKKYDLYYKVSHVTGDTSQDSCVTTVSSNLSWPHNNQALGVLKAASVEIDENGRTGMLLKAKHWGTKCPVCTDYSTGRCVDEHCSSCYGTGYEGGYYDAIPLNVLDVSYQGAQTRTQLNYGDDDILVAKCIAYPVINRGDIWVGDNMNGRYMIDSIAKVSVYKGTPIVYQLTMKRIEQSDVVYTKPVESIDSLLESASVDWEVLGK